MGPVRRSLYHLRYANSGKILEVGPVKLRSEAIACRGAFEPGPPVSHGSARAIRTVDNRELGLTMPIEALS